ncbi:MAG: protein-export chaperone SecB [Hyphomicrobiaceae bacterium]
MAETSKPDPKTSGSQQIQARVVSQYIKDLSFENPNIGKLLQGPIENMNVKIEVKVNPRTVAAAMYESAIEFKAQALNKTDVLYDLELVYAGLFKIDNMPAQAMEPFLHIHCPTLIFPFVRRLVADLTREGGFPPLLVDPIDFAGLFMRRKESE